MRQRPDAVRLPEEAVGRLSRQRLIEIGVALVLTLAALLFVALTVWAAEPGAIGIADAWARPTIGQGRTTAAYMTIMNRSGEDDLLKSARAAAAKSVELHQTSMTADGVMQMREVEDGLPIAVGETLKLEPGGTHLMIMGLSDSLAAGAELALTLEFDKAGAIDIAVPVSASGPDGVGADHSHH
ncbi:MAG: copper chaperone PCu(A)C [Methyloceanibacter sp.]|uniref:copper chaperone PCu(A)C n=1 Tax=Methyloceanibacter sp. TaxID=1965321 RepID=UPI003D6D6598